MPDETRLIFWLDVGILLITAVLVIAQQWDFVIALLIALAVTNAFDRLIKRHRS